MYEGGAAVARKRLLERSVDRLRNNCMNLPIARTAHNDIPLICSIDELSSMEGEEFLNSTYPILDAVA